MIVREGMYVTVLDCLRKPEDHSFRGEVLRVINVLNPFVVVQRQVHGTMTLDLRDYSLMQLTDEYVQAALPRVEEKECADPVDQFNPDSYTRKKLFIINVNDDGLEAYRDEYVQWLENGLRVARALRATWIKGANDIL